MDQVEAIVGVAPSTTIAEHIANICCLLHMTTKTIDIASISTLGKVIVVVVSIAVLHQVVGASSLIIANSHIVVHSNIFHYTIRAKAG